MRSWITTLPSQPCNFLSLSTQSLFANRVSLLFFPLLSACSANRILAMEAVRRLVSSHAGIVKKSDDISCNRPNKITSGGFLMDVDILSFSLPLFIVQVSLAVILIRSMIFILKPLRTPRVVSEIIAGIILGPSILGRSKTFEMMIFPARGKPLLGTISYIAIMFFHFLIGVKQDPHLIRTSGRKGLVIAAIGIIIPFLAATTIALLTRTTSQKYRGSFIIFLSLYSSMTSFPVVSMCLAELGLLNSDLGKLALSAAMLNDIVAWILTALSFAMRANTTFKFFFILLCFLSFVSVLIFAVRPAILWIIRKTPEGKAVEEIYITTILASVLVFGIIAEQIGASIVYGCLLFGLVIPSGPPLGSALVERTEGFVSGILMPTFFIINGLNTDFSAIANFTGWNYVLTIAFGCIGKLVGTVLPCLFYRMSLSDSFLLGLFMNTKGIIELVTFNRFYNKQMLSKQAFVIMLISLVILSSVISSIVSFFYDPKRARKYVSNKRRTIQNLEPGSESSIIACLYRTDNVPALINLIQLMHPTKKAPICAYPLQLVELKARAAPLLIAHNARSNMREFQPQSETAKILLAFEKFIESSDEGISIVPFTAIAPFSTIHQEICNLVEEKSSCLVVLPFHKQLNIAGTMEPISHAVRSINQNVLQQAPCSVGIFIDRGLGNTIGGSVSHVPHSVAMLFLGGAHDREALLLVTLMTNHPLTRITLLRLIPVGADPFNPEHDGMMERVMDDALLNDFRHKHANNRRVGYEEMVVNNVEEMVNAIKYMGDAYHLIVVGRGRNESSFLLGLEDWAECRELGAIGDMLSSDFGGSASVLVVQQFTGFGSRQSSIVGRSSDGSKASLLASKPPTLNSSSVSSVSTHSYTVG